jgi:hypothetical protein
VLLPNKKQAVIAQAAVSLPPDATARQLQALLRAQAPLLFPGGDSVTRGRSLLFCAGQGVLDNDLGLQDVGISSGFVLR